MFLPTKDGIYINLDNILYLGIDETSSWEKENGRFNIYAKLVIGEEIIIKYTKTYQEALNLLKEIITIIGEIK